MDKRVVLDIVARDWLDVRCLTRLLLTGDKSLKTLLVQNIRTLSQYYYADLRVFAWVWPRLALRTFVNVTEVSLVIPYPAKSDDIASGCWRKRMLIGRDLTIFPPGITSLRLVGSGYDTLPKKLYEKLANIDICSGIDDGGWIPCIEKNNNRKNGNLTSYNASQRQIQMRVDTSTVEKLNIGGMRDANAPSRSMITQFFMRSPLPNLTELNLFNIRGGIVDIGQLPPGLCKLRLFNIELDNLDVVHLSSLTSLTVEHCTCAWAGTNPPSTVISCPSSLLTLRVANNTQPHNAMITYVVPPGLSTLEINLFTEQVKVANDKTMENLTSLLVFNDDFYEHDPDPTVDEIAIILSLATNLRHLSIDCDDHGRLLQEISLTHPHLETLCYSPSSLSSRFFGLGLDDWVYHPSPSLVKCSVLSLVFPQQVDMIPMCTSLLELSLSVRLEHLTELNRVLRSLPRLENLQVRIDTTVPQLPEADGYDVSVFTPSSLIHLSLYFTDNQNSGTARRVRFSFIGNEECPTGVPPRLRSLELLAFNSARCHPNLSLEQVDQLPASLELYCGCRLTKEQRARLHNLI